MSDGFIPTKRYHVIDIIIKTLANCGKEGKIWLGTATQRDTQKLEEKGARRKARKTTQVILPTTAKRRNGREEKVARQPQAATNAIEKPRMVRGFIVAAKPSGLHQTQSAPEAAWD